MSGAQLILCIAGSAISGALGVYFLYRLGAHLCSPRAKQRDCPLVREARRSGRMSVEGVLFLAALASFGLCAMFVLLLRHPEVLN